jgi:hypothetical protein
MQISASNLLIASQQTQAPAQQPKSAATFAAALKANPAAEPKPAFEDLPLKRADAPAATASAAADAAKPAVTAQAARPGANLDIRI